jgi:uncharacterized protein
VQLVVIQPTPFCNIDCKYCYLPERAASHRMSPEVLEKACRFVLAQPDRLAQPLVIAWHAGEPLTVPLEFYEGAFTLLEKTAPPWFEVEHWFQTNATLIQEDWCDFFVRWNVRVGVSVDGPKWLHDVNRVDRRGKPTHDRVLRGIQHLRSRNVPFSTITVLTETALDYPDEIWNFLRHLGAESLAFNLEDVEGENRTSSLSGRTAPARVEAFFSRLLELRDRENPGIRIREVDCLLDGVPERRQEFRSMENVAPCVINIAWNGNVSTFSPELMGMKHQRYGDFVFGNVASTTLDSLLAGPKFLSVAEEIEAGVAECREICGYFDLCGGGAPSAKLFGNGTFRSSETLACKLRIKSISNAALHFWEHQYSFRPEPESSIPARVERLRFHLARVQPKKEKAQVTVPRMPKLEIA